MVADPISAKAQQNFAKHVDFLVCDRNFKPVLAIEVNSSSHHRADRMASDEVKRAIFEDAGLPFKTIRVGESFEHSINEILGSLG